MYASYQDYVQRFGGRAIPDEAEFNRLAERAGAVLDRLSCGRAARYRDCEGKLALACCAVTEKLYEQEELRRGGSAGIVSERVGDWQVQYRKTDWTGLTAELAALAEMYLFGTGLLYCGVRVQCRY
ncbi:MAG: hypothetical protein J6P58_05395 [Oscillospiraceae bacterium]|nr:hypothetical protein [Oscillospiraceae bacterium]